MAKQKTQKQQPLSPEQYIRTKARTLPIEACYMEPTWHEMGLTVVIVARRHAQGTYTLGTYIVDTFCKGVVEAGFHFSITTAKYEEMVEYFKKERGIAAAEYNEVHNLIYGAIAYAEEAGITPCKSFAIAQYILDEDTDDVPLIEYEFGKDGKYFLVAKDRLELSRYLPLLDTNLAPDDFSFVVLDQEEEGDEEEEDGEWKEDDMVLYSYVHPEYPMVLNVKHQHLLPLLYASENEFGLPEDKIKEILALPREELIRDLEQIILFETGCTCDDISPEKWESPVSSQLVHCLFLLTELKAEESLPVVLETLRQNEAYFEFHFGDSADDVYTATLYVLGRNQLGMLLDYAKEPGLYTYARYNIFPAVAYIAYKEPERREEIIEWFRQILVFYTEKLAEKTCCDGVLCDLMMCVLLVIRATELLPEIKAIYDTNLVDINSSGDYQKVERDMISGASSQPWVLPMDINERYREYAKAWKRPS